MEHIERMSVGSFQKEIFRVLKPGGIQRICVPDLEQLVRKYNNTLTADDRSLASSRLHDEAVSRMFDQCVRRAPAGNEGRSRSRIWLETLLLGDARARGETHQWMWDRVNIRALLADVGLTDIRTCSWEVSDIERWRETGLERAENGTEYHPGSLYVECRMPQSLACAPSLPIAAE